MERGDLLILNDPPKDFLKYWSLGVAPLFDINKFGLVILGDHRKRKRILYYCPYRTELIVVKTGEKIYSKDKNFMHRQYVEVKPNSRISWRLISSF